jgi:single-stranded DNA-binding protein
MLLTTLIGHLGRDAEVKTNQASGKSLILFSVGVTTGKDANGNSVTTWVNVKASESMFKGVLPYLKKGQAVCVNGDGSLESWDKKDGTGKGFALAVWASKIQLVGSKSKDESAAPTPDSRPPAPAPRNDFADDDSSVPF